MPSSDDNHGPVAEGGAIARVVAVLEALVESGADGTGPRELSARLGISRSAVHRVLVSLAQLNVARTRPTGRYEAGFRLIRWAALLSQRNALLVVAETVLTALVDEVGESAYLAVHDNDDDSIVFVAQARCDKPIQYVVPMGSRAPLYAGAAGKAVLAFLPEAAVKSQKLERLTEHTIADRTSLKGDLAAVRERGYACSEGERIAEAAGVAAPFFQDDTVAGVITVSMPRYRLADHDVDALGRRIAVATRDLSEALVAKASLP